MKPIHDRMPVIRPPEAWDAWLDPTNDDTEALAKLLVPAPADFLVAHPVSTAVNSTRNNGPDLIAEATGDQLVRQGSPADSRGRHQRDIQIGE